MTQWVEYRTDTGEIVYEGSSQMVVFDGRAGVAALEVENLPRGRAYVAAGALVEIPLPPSVHHAWDWQAKGWIDPRTLDDHKAAKNEQINGWRLAANRDCFIFAGKEIACDELSRSDIDGVNGMVAITGALSPGFPMAWKAKDNSYVPIADVAAWKTFYAALVAKGTANFAHAQALKAQLAAITDGPNAVAQVEAIQW